MRKDFIIATFDDDEKVLHATEKAMDKKISIYDIFTPFPVHGLDEAMGIKRSILPYVTLLAGAAGLATALALQIWTQAIDWPMNFGGKPANSIPAFIPVSFELTVLFGAHTTVAAFLVINKLFPGKKPVIIDPAQTEDKFIMAIEKDGNNVDDVTKLLSEEGALSVEVKNIDLNP
tara:strand:+ start:137776 stop:138300 length:525 start_codon:yes stop_codon:yes gene_type:complete